MVDVFNVKGVQGKLASAYLWKGGALLVGILALFLLAGGQGAAQQPGERTVSKTGKLALVRNGVEIWVVNADNTNARKIWEIPEHRRYEGMESIQELRWNKNGDQLAFSSAHEPLCSLYQRNIYVINTDGSGLQRLTNRPSCDEMGHLFTGTVTIELSSEFADILPFQVFVEGAPEPVFVNLAVPQTITIPNVPDLGPGVEQLVVMVSGSNRWFHLPGVDVIPGQTVHAGSMVIGNDNVIRNGFRAWAPSWSPDGSTLAFLVASGLPQQIPLNGGVLRRSTRLFGEGIDPAFATDLVWSPVNNTILYSASDNSDGGYGIYQAQVGSNQPAQLVIGTDQTRGLSWLPDGTGFVVANYYQEFFITPVHSNLYRIDLPSNQATALTNYAGNFAYNPSVSPDGQQVMFVYYDDGESTTSHLRTVPISGGETTDFGAQNLFSPAWGPGSASAEPPTPTPTTPAPGESSHNLFLPFTVR